MKGTNDAPQIDLSWIENIQKSDKVDIDEPTKVEKWEYEKKMSKKLEVTKSKLLKKTKEFLDSEKIIHSLRTTLERIERERTRLASKVSQLSLCSQKDELEKIISEKAARITELEDKMIRLEKDFIKKMDEERTEYENNLEKYEANEKMLQDLIKKLEAEITALTFAEDRADAMSAVKSDDFKQVKDKCKRLEKEKLLLESDLLELKLEKEKGAFDSCKEKQVQGIQDLVPLPKKRTGYRGKTSNELLQVIDQLSRAIEKVNAENDALKKSAISPVKYQEATRDLKKLREEFDKVNDERKNADLYVRQSSRYF